MFGREARVRLFLAFLILVLVVVNSQSLLNSQHSRDALIASFDRSVRATAELIAVELSREKKPLDSSAASVFLAEAAKKRGLESACLFDLDARLLTGGACAPSAARAFDRLDADGRRSLLGQGWAITGAIPAYDPESATVAGYLMTENGIIRVESPAGPVALANRRLRTTLIYQVSALSFVLVAVFLFLRSLLAPHRKLVAEARSVATELSDGLPDSRDEAEFLLGTFQEVVARLKRKEDELASLHRLEKARADESEALASDIIRSMTTGLVSLDASGVVAMVNPAARRIFGVDADVSAGRPFADVFRGSDELERWISDAIERSESHLRGGIRYRTSTGETLHLGVSVIPLLSDEGRARGALCLVADLTEVVELRSRLLLKDNLARLGEMAAGIAHEFRNALATILGNARLLRAEVEGESREVADALIQEGQSLTHVVTEFLQFARPESLSSEHVDLHDMLRGLVEEMRERASESHVALTFEGDRVGMEGDSRLLRKAFSNLVLNAIESLSDAPPRAGRVEVHLSRYDGYAVVRVRDNGPGISAADREKIFTPFFTRKERGTGLGLSVVQKVVVSHNGTIELEPAQAGGASFVVRLPLEVLGSSSSDPWV
ncbi:MAG TPA: ATP-binding protein [Vicinamibacteria bacterium]|nr:ATP-binding protein [Vicinamibacteria bacterium]